MNLVGNTRKFSIFLPPKNISSVRCPIQSRAFATKGPPSIFRTFLQNFLVVGSLSRYSPPLTPNRPISSLFPFQLESCRKSVKDRKDRQRRRASIRSTSSGRQRTNKRHLIRLNPPRPHQMSLPRKLGARARRNECELFWRNKRS